MKKIFAMLTVATLLLTGCGANPQTTKTEKISIVGSTSVQPLAQELADEYSKNGTQIDIQGVGSGAGIKAIQDGTCDIGTSSRELTAVEKATGLKEYIIAYDGIAVVFNPKNTVSNLTIDQASKIFKGEIKNWKEVGGEDKEIIVVSREAGSGTRTAFEELMKVQKDAEKDGKTVKVSALYEKAQVAEGNGAIKQNIASKENAIGYISIGFIDSTLKASKIDGIDATEANVKAKTYKVMRPFLMLTKGQENPATKAFIDYIMGDAGQKIVSEKYITIK